MNDDKDRPPEADLSKVRTVPIMRRANKVRSQDLAQPPGADRSFHAFLTALPDILEARSFNAIVAALVSAAQQRRAVVAMLGGHVVKTGLAPIIIELMKRGVITHLASNGAAVIHDYEMARWGGTSEDVEAGLTDGSFGMADETGRDMNNAIRQGAQNGWGLGESLARDLEQRADVQNGAASLPERSGPEAARSSPRGAASAAGELSLLLQSRKLGVPFTVHAALGAEIIHQHPAADGGAIGATSFTDFKRLSAHLVNLEGGVVLNIGSAVIMPEVFLKALTICRNLNAGVPRAFVAADFDMIRHYRPRVNVVERPTRTGGGQGFQITGHHELMIPLLAWAVLDRLENLKT